MHTVNIRCSSCKCVYFCEEICQKRAWSHHKLLCQSGAKLQQERTMKVFATGMYPTNLTLKEETTVATLVGEKCNISCFLDDSPSVVLLHTGAQVSMLSTAQLHRQFPKTKLRDIREILDKPDALSMQWESNTDISFAVWVNMRVKIGDGQDKMEVRLREHGLVVKSPDLKTLG